MKIAVCGMGVVGGAVANALRHFHTVVGIDPRLGPDTVADLSHTDAVVVCVPTPSGRNGSCDPKHLVDVLSTVEEKTPVLVKSTVSMQVWKELTQLFPSHSLSFSPEFLVQATADTDFASSAEMYIGGTPEAAQFWVSDVFIPAFPKCVFVHMTVAEAILVKYFRNTFLASKVVWFNEAKEISDSVGCNWDVVRMGVARDNRIGDSHTNVTPIGGYGGACFPKDVQALLAEHRHSMVLAAHQWNLNNRGRELPPS